MQPRFPVVFAALILVAISGVQAQEEPDTTTVLVTVTEAHSVCLIQTATLPEAKVHSIADRFLNEQGINAHQRSSVERHPDFQALLKAYIEERGGCRTLVNELMP